MTIEHALDILQRKEYIEKENHCFGFRATDATGHYICSWTKTIKGIMVDVKDRGIMGKFEMKLKKKMEDNGYIAIRKIIQSKESDKYHTVFIKEKDVIELCQNPPFTTNEVVYFKDIDGKIEEIMKEYFRKNDSYTVCDETYHPCSGVWGTLLKVTNLNIQETRKNGEIERQESALELLDEIL